MDANEERFKAMSQEKPDFELPSQAEIVNVLRSHPLIRLREKVTRAFLVGSFAKGSTHAESDVDILLEVVAKPGYTSDELEEHYRHALRQYFVTNNIKVKADHIHPNWCGRRVDVYFTYDAGSETRAKIELVQAPRSKLRNKP